MQDRLGGDVYSSPCNLLACVGAHDHHNAGCGAAAVLCLDMTQAAPVCVLEVWACQPVAAAVRAIVKDGGAVVGQYALAELIC